MSKIKELTSLKGRRAVVTGAAGQIGKKIVDTLAELGADLILVDRSGKDLVNQKVDLESKWGVGVDFYECDLENENDRERLISSVKAENNSLNILVNNAAFIGETDLKGWVTRFEEQSIETWRRALEVNLTAAFHLSQKLMPLLKLGKGANIINVGSIYGEYGPDWGLYDGTNMGNPAAYAASKAGLIQLTRWLATTIAPEVRVNAISPGGISRNQDVEFVKRYVKRTPLKRMGCEDDLRGVILFLSTDLSSYVTGQNIFIDGGWGVW